MVERAAQLGHALEQAHQEADPARHQGFYRSTPEQQRGRRRHQRMHHETPWRGNARRATHDGAQLLGARARVELAPRHRVHQRVQVGQLLEVLLARLAAHQERALLGRRAERDEHGRGRAEVLALGAEARAERPERVDDEHGDIGRIPNPLQQTFDRRAIQQERMQRREPREDGPIPNPLQQNFDKRAFQQARAQREINEDGPIPNPLQQTYDKRFVQKGGGLPQGRGAGGRNKSPSTPRQPDPMQTAVGYIGADTFLRKGAGNRGGGRSGRGGKPGRGGGGGGRGR